MKSQNTKSSDELQQEIRQDIHNVNKDMAGFMGRLTPGQFIDDAIFYPHGASIGATFDYLRRNPIGTTLLSLGTLLLMEDETHASYENRAKTKVGSARTAAMEKIHKVKEGLKSKVDTVGAEVTRSHKMPVTPKKIFTALSSSKEKISSGMEVGKQKIKNLDPTAFIAIGAGLGVLTGATLPIKARESHLGGELEVRLQEFNTDLRSAVDECTNILRELVMQDFKDRIRIF